MKVTEVTVAAKYSLDTGPGWKAIEVGATASLTSGETLELAQQELYDRLSRQLKALWAKGKPEDSAQYALEGPRIDTQPSGAPLPPTTHWCFEHGVEFKRHEKDGNVWYSHRQNAGWCNESR